MEGLSLQKVEVICLSDFLYVYQLGVGSTNILVQLAQLQRVCSMLPSFPHILQAINCYLRGSHF